MIVDVHKKGGLRPYFDVYIGRRTRNTEFKEDSIFCNPYLSLEEYENMARELLWDNLDELKGKTLGCWCITTDKIEPLVCHGQVLMKLLREKCQNTT